MADVGGLITLKADGEAVSVNGNFKIRPYTTTREILVDVNSVKGAKLMSQSSMIEGEITERPAGVGLKKVA